jgi:hypothetical protein
MRNAVAAVLLVSLMSLAGCEGSSSPGELKVVTDETFDAQTATGVVLADFWAPW